MSGSRCKGVFNGALTSRDKTRRSSFCLLLSGHERLKTTQGRICRAQSIVFVVFSLHILRWKKKQLFLKALECFEQSVPCELKV